MASATRSTGVCLCDRCDWVLPWHCSERGLLLCQHNVTVIVRQCYCIEQCYQSYCVITVQHSVTCVFVGRVSSSSSNVRNAWKRGSLNPKF